MRSATISSADYLLGDFFEFLKKEQFLENTAVFVFPDHFLMGKYGEMYKKLEIVERHRHRYEVNPRYKNRMIEAGLDVVGTSVDGRLVEMIEIPNHKWFLACQFHPEFTSNPRDGHPIFNSYIKSTLLK